MNVLPVCLGRAYASGASSGRAASVLNGGAISPVHPLFNKKGKTPNPKHTQIFTALTLGEYSDKREVISRAASQAGIPYVSEREVVMPCISVYCDIVLVYTTMRTETTELAMC